MWQTPKTNWTVSDYYNAADYNRIKNNIEYLHNIARVLYDVSPIKTLNDKTIGDYFYADEMNQIEANFAAINAQTLLMDYGESPIYVDYGNTPDAVELNRLENAILDLYGYLKNQYEGRKLLTFNFGVEGGF